MYPAAPSFLIMPSAVSKYCTVSPEASVIVTTMCFPVYAYVHLYEYVYVHVYLYVPLIVTTKWFPAAA